MPSTSKKQAHLMAAVAHNPAFAKKVGIPQSVGKDFNQADKGRKFGSGGMAKMEHSEKGEMKADIAQDKKLIKRAFGMHDKQEHPGKKTNLSKLKGGGMAGAKETMGPRTMSKDVEAGSNTKRPFGQHGVQKRGLTRGAEMRNPVIEPTNIGTKAKVKAMKSGGLAAGHKSADGIASKGKTRNRTITMCGGGMVKKGKK